MKKGFGVFVGFCVVGVLCFAAGGSSGGSISENPVAQTKGKKSFRKLMQKKLSSSKNLLEGLALGDFKKIKTNADELQKLTTQAEWFAYKTKEYKLFSSEFRRAAEKVSDNAKKLNLDGAALGYLELTLTCVRCHQYVRNVREAQFRDGPTEHSFD